MCGIVGLFGASLDPCWKEDLPAMAHAIRHRGPDDFGFFWENAPGNRPLKEIPQTNNARVAFAHRRLSILDLSEQARQPMTQNNGEIFLTYNGEVYNYKELQKELGLNNSDLITHSDTEIVLHAYQKWGTASFVKLRGIFSFAIADLKKGLVFLVRDHLGVKPLYYTKIGSTFAFASEIKSFLKHRHFQPKADFEALREYLQYLWIPGAKTGFLGVQKLKPGTFLKYDLQRETAEIQSYWSLLDQSFAEEKVQPLEATLEELRDILGRAVKEELVSDVPLGAFLSGGLDSSLIVSLMQKTAGKNPKTFSVGFAKEDISYDIVPDDLPYAKKVSRQLGVENEAILLKPNVAELLPKIVWHLDEPIGDPAAISSYLVCEKAKPSLTVMLSGVGGDELFAGYPRQRALMYGILFRKFPKWSQNLFGKWSQGLPGSGKTLSAKMGRASKKFLLAATADPLTHYATMQSYFTDSQQAELLNPQGSFGSGFFPAKTEQALLIELLRKTTPNEALKQAISLDLLAFLPCLNLAYTDKTSMAAGVEVRVPFLDIRLVEWALKQRSQWLLKISRGKLQGKWLLKKAAEGFLPSEIIWRKKAGFGAPIRSWLRNDLAEMREQLLGKRGLGGRDWFEPKTLQKVESDFLSGKEDNALKLWQLMSLELWAQQYGIR